MNIQEQIDALKEERQDKDERRKKLPKETDERVKLWHEVVALRKQLEQLERSEEYKQFNKTKEEQFQEKMKPRLDAFLADYRELCKKHGACITADVDYEDYRGLVVIDNDDLDEMISDLKANGWSK